MSIGLTSAVRLGALLVFASGLFAPVAVYSEKAAPECACGKSCRCAEGAGKCACGNECACAAKDKKHVCGPECRHAHMGAMCPIRVPGAEVKVENVDDGVIIRVVSKDKDSVKKIQAAGAKIAKGECGCGHGRGKAAKQGAWSCPMKGCYTGEKTEDGRCPHCGMKLKKAE